MARERRRVLLQETHTHRTQFPQRGVGAAFRQDQGAQHLSQNFCFLCFQIQIARRSGQGSCSAAHFVYLATFIISKIPSRMVWAARLFSSWYMAMLKDLHRFNPVTSGETRTWRVGADDRLTRLEKSFWAQIFARERIRMQTAEAIKGHCNNHKIKTEHERGYSLQKLGVHSCLPKVRDLDSSQAGTLYSFRVSLSLFGSSFICCHHSSFPCCLAAVVMFLKALLQTPQCPFPEGKADNNNQDSQR